MFCWRSPQSPLGAKLALLTVHVYIRDAQCVTGALQCLCQLADAASFYPAPIFCQILPLIIALIAIKDMGRYNSDKSEQCQVDQKGQDKLKQF